LNDAIVCADISNSYEEFLAIVDEFYSDAVEVRSAASPEPVIGKAHVKSVLLGFLIPLHVMAEIGGLSVRVHEMPLAGDSREDRHSCWSVSWTVRRRWEQSRVVDEYHYDHHHEGDPLSFSDLRIVAPNEEE
jgi:hypothetical protein